MYHVKNKRSWVISKESDNTVKVIALGRDGDPIYIPNSISKQYTQDVENIKTEGNYIFIIDDEEINKFLAMKELTE